MIAFLCSKLFSCLHFHFLGLFSGFFRFSISTPGLCYVYLNCIPSLPRLPSFQSYIIIYPRIDISLFYFFPACFPTVHIQDTLTATISRFLDVDIFFFLFLRRRHVLGNIII
jgi:hypothetical protein